MTKDVRTTIVQTINKIRSDTGRDPAAPQDDDHLTGALELDSLDLAVLVVSLEQELGTDPFRDGQATARTLGDLITVYEKALAS